MSDVTGVRSQGQGRRLVICAGCGFEKPYYSKDMCQNCYQQAAAARKVGTCEKCGQAGQIFSGGKCCRCYKRSRQEDKGATDRRKKSYTPEQLAFAKARGREFEEDVLPKVARYARRF